MQLKITDYTSSGEGVGKHDSFVYFVPFALIGETVKVKITKRHKSYARAEIIEIIEPSPERITPECPHFGICGGCDLLHMSYQEELRFKQNKVAKALRMEEVPIIPSPIIHHYRNKTIWQTDGKKVGLYAKKSNDVIEVEECLLQSKQANKLKNQQLFYREPIQKLCGLEFTVSEKSFFQINNASAEKLFEIITSNISPNDNVLDLYCGVGAITLCVALKAKTVVGVEINAQAVEEAITNARNNGITNSEFIFGESEKIINTVDFTQFDAIILDPPRAGCDKHLIETLRNSGISKIIYVSCDPATLSRDLKMLDNYTIQSATAVDMFPRTPHIESCVILTRS
jgi:23S rRNA (uracil1939-C5)-methyltransferase